LKRRREQHYGRWLGGHGKSKGVVENLAFLSCTLVLENWSYRKVIQFLRAVQIPQYTWRR
jgi:hypothetical protein